MNPSRRQLGGAAAALLAATATAAQADTPRSTEERAIYHVNDASSARDALNFMQNHIAASPAARIVLLANGRGVFSLVAGERDRQGEYATAIAALQAKGVRFLACRNSMTKNNVAESALAPNVQVVAAGVVELARLQNVENYAYIKP